MTSPSFAWKLVTVLLVAATLATVPGISAGNDPPATADEPRQTTTPPTLLGWNDLGMHCMDEDFSVFAILPPFNNVNAQLIDATGNLVRTPGSYQVTYAAVADPDGSMNRSSIGDTNFWDHDVDLFGVDLLPDAGLTGFDMPGTANTPQTMHFDTAWSWFMAEGIPITPIDDSGNRNPYPLMRLLVRDGSGTAIATTYVVLPVSTEMDCQVCHGSGTQAAAQPAAGWVNDPNPVIDYRHNILRLHDGLQMGNPTYTNALATAGYDPTGLEATYLGGTAILCATCHRSNALPGTGITGISQLTMALHGGHATVIDPVTGLSLDAATNRNACYRCHPGNETRCLRGAMGVAVAADGTYAMSCQSCHGSMSFMARAGREAWLDEPTCQSCHTGTATQNSGQIRYTSSFIEPGVYRSAADMTFASDPGVPAAGYDLYRYSTGHGDLQCSACHGSTHAIYPTREENDQIQSMLLQGHRGTIAECTTCHTSVPNTVAGGPHGLHPLGAPWVDLHRETGANPGCQECHGSDWRGTVLSQVTEERTLDTSSGARTMWRGFRIGCYTCHNGPFNDGSNSNRPPAVASAVATADPGQEVTIPISASDPDGDAFELRIVSQSYDGAAWLVGTTAHFLPDTDFSGSTTFTVAANDGQTDSNLATVTVTVSGQIFADGFESGDTTAWSLIIP